MHDAQANVRYVAPTPTATGMSLKPRLSRVELSGLCSTVLSFLFATVVVGLSWGQLGPASLLLLEALLISWIFLRPAVLRLSPALWSVGLAGVAASLIGWREEIPWMFWVGISLLGPGLINSGTQLLRGSGNASEAGGPVVSFPSIGRSDQRRAGSLPVKRTGTGPRAA